MSYEVTGDEFRRRWLSHVGELRSLKWLLEDEDRERVDELRDELEALVETAVENREADE